MVLLASIRIALAYAIWRLTGLRSAGRVLIRALGAEADNVRMMAGIVLEQAGRQAKRLLEEALRQRLHLPQVLTILADIGDHDLESDIRRLSEDSDPEVAKAAREALRILAAH